jgi:diguanylate cyclase (GGDEF)-like protein
MAKLRHGNPFARFHGLSLRAGLAIAFVAMIVLALTVGLVSLLTQQQLVRAVDKLLEVDVRIADLSASSNVAMLKARRAEKDFLLYRREFGFDEARSRYATLLRFSVAEIRQHMAAIRALSSEPAAIERTLEVERALSRYEAGFLRIVELYGALGYVNTGLEGQFRETAHRIEAIVSGPGEIRLLADLLALRRHEKDFIARGLDKDAEASAKGIDRFKTDLLAARLSSERKEELLALADMYARLFEQYVQTDARIDAESATYVAAAHTIEPMLDELRIVALRSEIATRNDAEDVARLAAWTISAAMFMALLLGAAVAWRVARAITRSVDACLDFANRVAQGDLTRRLTPSGRNEFAAMATALNRMTEALQEREAGLERLNRMHAVLSGINGAIVRIRDGTELLREACRIAVDAGQLSFVWIGLVDGERVVPAAWHGAESGFLDLIRDRLSLREESPAAQSLVVQAAKAKNAVISNDVHSDPRIQFKSEHEARGFLSVAAFPLLVSGEVTGILVLHAREPGFFDDEETKLLHELAGDIAFALDHIEKEKRLDYLAYYDSLTGLANRTLFLERLNQQIHAAGNAQGKVALVLADIERLRTINDSLGRQAGDALLKEAAGRLARAAQASEIGRIGTDHFAIMLPAVKGKSEVIRDIARLSHRCFGEPFRLDGNEIKVAAKSGIVLFPNDGADAETLLRNAEAALRKAKESGERYAFYSRSLTERVGERLTLETRLRQALEKDEFVLHYQPKVDLEARRIVGVEALIRWHNPELGLVPPGEFIPLMEETGLIVEVGAWALSRAVADHMRWLEEGLAAPRVAVNVSAIQLRRGDFFSSMANALKRGATPPGIDLEITESLVMEDIESNVRKLKAVRALGVSIAIDDFGTGYSSLGYLAKLPVQSLKIDRSFIITMVDDPDTTTLVRTIITLAHSLRLKVVAEGVDSEEQARFLRLLRCDEMQGYLFSRPVPFDDMNALLKEKGRELESIRDH